MGAARPTAVADEWDSPPPGPQLGQYRIPIAANLTILSGATRGPSGSQQIGQYVRGPRGKRDAREYRAMQPNRELSELRTGPSGIVLDPRARTVTIDDQPLLLTRLGFDLLAVLLDRRGEVVTHDELASLAWGQQPIGEHGAILTGVYRLRQALDTAGATNVIRAVRGVGYTIDGPRNASPALLERSALEAAFRASSAPAMLVDLEGHVTSANDAAAVLTGIEVETLERLPAWMAILTEAAWTTASMPFALAAGGQTPAPFVASVVRTDCETQPVHVSMAPIHGRTEQIGVLVTLMPATHALTGGSTGGRDRGTRRGPNGFEGEAGRHWRAG